MYVRIYTNSLPTLKYTGHSLPSNTTSVWHVLRKWFVASMDINPHTENQLHTWTYFWDIANLLFWSISGMSNHVRLNHPNIYQSVLCLYGFLSIYKKKSIYASTHSWDIELSKKIILGYNSTRISLTWNLQWEA